MHRAYICIPKGIDKKERRSDRSQVSPKSNRPNNIKPGECGIWLDAVPSSLLGQHLHPYSSLEGPASSGLQQRCHLPTTSERLLSWQWEYTILHPLRLIPLPPSLHTEISSFKAQPQRPVPKWAFSGLLSHAYLACLFWFITFNDITENPVPCIIETWIRDFFELPFGKAGVTYLCTPSSPWPPAFTQWVCYKWVGGYPTQGLQSRILDRVQLHTYQVIGPPKNKIKFLDQMFQDPI